MSGKLNGRLLSDADLERLADLLAPRLANELRSRTGSPIGIGARDQGDLECDEKDWNVSMDPTIEEPASNDGESSSPQQTAAKLLSRSRQKQKLRALPTLHVRKPKAAP